MISRTPTRFAACIRRVGGLRYNHAAVGLDAGLRRLYAFARPQHHAVLQGRLVRESLDRYTLRQPVTVPVVVFRLTVSEQQYRWVQQTIARIQSDPGYLYNLVSVLTYPLFRGLTMEKSFSCMEFVVYVLKQLGYPLRRPCCRYRPDDLIRLLPDCIVYEGDVRGCVRSDYCDDQYFKPLSGGMVVGNIWGMLRVLARTAHTCL